MNSLPIETYVHRKIICMQTTVYTQIQKHTIIKHHRKHIFITLFQLSNFKDKYFSTIIIYWAKIIQKGLTYSFLYMI